MRHPLAALTPLFALIAATFLLVALFLAGCSRAAATAPGTPAPSTPPPTMPPPSGPPAVDPGDPLAQPAEAAAGLTNVGADLDAVLEHGTLTGACDRWRAGATDEHTRLLCGKQMFFYEPFGTGGVPTVLAQFLVDNFPAEIGAGFGKLGMIADPASAQHLPLGLATTRKLGGTIDAVAFTCASCHFAQLPDGRYAVGAPNHRYEYGKQILSLLLMPSVALLNQTSGHDPAALAVVQPLLDRINADSALKQRLLTALLPLAGAANMPTLSASDEHHYASWPAGTMDFLIAPLPVDDKVHTVSKVSALWSIPTPAERADAQLGWTGGSARVIDFLHDFVVIGGGDATAWSDDRLQPLADYIASLRAPANPSPPDAAAVERGRLLFASDGCAACHDGPRGMGTRLYDYGEIGTDAQMRRWLETGVPAGARVTLTQKLKSPRLVGSWAVGRFLHNGSLATLEALFCVTPRPTATEPAMTSVGHDMTCTLAAADKQDLMAYLRAR